MINVGTEGLDVPMLAVQREQLLGILHTTILHHVGNHVERFPVRSFEFRLQARINRQHILHLHRRKHCATECFADDESTHFLVSICRSPTSISGRHNHCIRLRKCPHRCQDAIHMARNQTEMLAHIADAPGMGLSQESIEQRTYLLQTSFIGIEMLLHLCNGFQLLALPIHQDAVARFHIPFIDRVVVEHHKEIPKLWSRRQIARTGGEDERQEFSHLIWQEVDS